jgi:REP element-mobilizing transposase RayT
MRKSKSQPSFAFLGPDRREHGGVLRAGKRKLARPIDPKRPLHLTLRATQARGEWSFLHPKHAHLIERLTGTLARKWGVRIYQKANVGNHLHLLVKAPGREAFQGFLRELSGRIAALVTKARKGRPLRQRFWDELAWSRIVEWGRDFSHAQIYVIKNLLEGVGAKGSRLVTLGFDRPPKINYTHI